jgi:hypothetical protein
MADEVFQFVVSLASTTGLPADTTQNVLHAGRDAVLGVNDIADGLAAVADFFTTLAVGQAENVGDYISESISRAANAHTVTAYSSTDLSGATPFGSPVGQTSFTIGAAVAGSPFPEEVAAVISYNANLTDVPVSEPNPSPPPATIRPAQRRRGRMFVGPLQAATGTEVSGIIRPSPTFRADLCLAFEQMASAFNATDSLYLGVWSRADAEVWQVGEGYVDDAWDTQRRRGVAATTRTTFTV